MEWFLTWLWNLRRVLGRIGFDVGTKSRRLLDLAQFLLRWSMERCEFLEFAAGLVESEFDVVLTDEIE